MEIYSKLFTKSCIKNILNQMENSIYEITEKEKKIGILIL